MNKDLSLVICTVCGREYAVERTKQTPKKYEPIEFKCQCGNSRIIKGDEK